MLAWSICHANWSSLHSSSNRLRELIYSSRERICRHASHENCSADLDLFAVNSWYFGFRPLSKNAEINHVLRYLFNFSWYGDCTNEILHTSIRMTRAVLARHVHLSIWCKVMSSTLPAFCLLLLAAWQVGVRCLNAHHATKRGTCNMRSPGPQLIQPLATALGRNVVFFSLSFE